MIWITLLIHNFTTDENLLYFSECKTHSPLQIWEGNGGASYSPNVAYLACGGGGAIYVIKHFTTFFASNFFFLFSSSKT